MKVYPNPTTGLITVQSLTFQVERIDVIDLNGKVLKIFGKTQINNDLKFDIGHLSRGVYIIKILTGDSVSTFLVLLN
jgi:hypothetical protein